MATYNLNKILHLARTAQNIRQSELCDGICTVETLSRIENGKQQSSDAIFNPLMERLNRQIYTDPCFYTYDAEWNRLCNLYQSSMDGANLSEAKQHLSHLKEYATSISQKQFVTSRESNLQYLSEKITVPKSRSMTDSALRMTMPHYDQYLTTTFPYTLEECRILTNLGNTYNDEEPADNDRALALYRAALRSIDAGYMCGKDVDKLKFSIFFNVCYVYSDTKQYHKAIQIDKDMFLLALNADKGGNAAAFLSEIIWNLKMLSQEEALSPADHADYQEQIRKILYKAIYTARTVDYHSFADLLEKKNSSLL